MVKKKGKAPSTEWYVIPFGDCLSTLGNNTLPRAALNYDEGRIRNIHYGDVLIKFPSVLDVQREKLPYINSDVAYSIRSSFLQEGDVVIADTAEDETVGKATEINNLQNESVVAGLHTIPCRPKNGEMFASKYLGYYINHSSFHDQIVPYITGIKVSSISKSSLEYALISVPPIDEQKRIVEILSDVDELILNLEKLIRKKIAIKQGAIQQLVTGKTRLAGYKGDWQTINMSSQSKLKARIGWQGLTTAEYLDTGYSYLITGTDFDGGRVNWSRCHFVSQDRYVQDPNIQIENGDVLLTKDGTIGKVALVDGLGRPATLNSGVFVIRPLNRAYSAQFLYYVLSSSVFEDFLDKLAAGSTISHLYQKDLVEFEFKAPPTIEEQEDIAALIYDMESEIRELQYQREKYANLKTGMMNELLTGRTRLV